MPRLSAVGISGLQAGEDVKVLEGDCLERMKELADNSVDAVVTDPPYGLRFMGRDWDKGVPGVAFWSEMRRILKPGGYLLSFGGTRTYHRLACAIEDAGFVLHPMVGWVFASGFPKAANLGKALDKAAGVDREVVSEGKPVKRMIPGADQDKTGSWIKDNGRVFVPQETAPATDAARQWEGWYYGLQSMKPAIEPICMAQKPTDGSMVENVLKWGTGGVNVDGCRVTADPIYTHGSSNLHQKSGGSTYNIATYEKRFIRCPPSPIGRFPANLIHDASPEVIALFPAAPGQLAPISHTAPSAKTSNVYGKMNREGEASVGRHDTGSAARFFKACPPDPELDYPPLYYSAKAPRSERGDSKHPTIKPLSLMRYLIRLVTPPGGTVLDPFAGSGTTGEAAILEGFSAILIEREAEYIADIRARIERAERMVREQTMQPSLFSTEPHFPEDSMS